MMTFIVISKYIFLFLSIHQILYWVYFWQRKEYRIDRFRASFERFADVKQSIVRQLTLRYWYLPKATTRAVLSILIAFTLTFFMWRLLDGYAITMLIFLAPLIATSAIFITAPFFWILKRIVIYRATRRMKQFTGMVIGITGSFGKSSTKELLALALAGSFPVARTMRNDNSEIGVALTALKIPLDSKVFIVEMGAYRRGDIKAICDIVHPRIGVITGIGDQHVALFGSIEILKKTKYELIEAIPQDGMRLIANENYSADEATNIRVAKDRTYFTYEGQEFSMPFLGKERISNSIAVIKIAHYLGVSLLDIARRFEHVSVDILYPKLRAGKNGCGIIDDTYNSSTESFLSALAYLSAWEGYTKIVVTPGIIELGEHAHADHIRIGKALHIVDKVLVTSPNFFTELNTSGNATLVTDHHALDALLEKMLTSNTVILFEGRTPWAIIKKCLA